MAEEIKLFRVATLTIGPVQALGLVVIRPDFLTHPMESPEQARTGRTYVLTPVQARDLVQRTLQALATLENGPPPTGVGPQH